MIESFHLIMLEGKPRYNCQALLLVKCKQTTLSVYPPKTNTLGSNTLPFSDTAVFVLDRLLLFFFLLWRAPSLRT